MSREERRHHRHPMVPRPAGSKKRILDHENPKTFSHAKGYPSRRRGKWKVI